MRTIEVNLNIDDKWDDVRILLERIVPLIDPKETDKDWRVDLSGSRYLGPDAAVLLYSFWMRAKQLGRRVDVDLPTTPPKLDGFCRYSGLVHYICGGVRPSEDHPNSETVPLTQIYQAQYQSGRPLLKLVKRHLPQLSDESEEYLRMSLSETIQNIEDHSNSPIGGIWCGRFFCQSLQVRLAVVDLGDGIFETLSKAHPAVQDSASAIQKVLQGGWSSGSRANNLGLGLSHLANWTSLCNGTLDLVSGDAVAHIGPTAKGPLIKQLPFFFQGTGIFLTLEVEESDGTGYGFN